MVETSPPPPDSNFGGARVSIRTTAPRSRDRSGRPRRADHAVQAHVEGRIQHADGAGCAWREGAQVSPLMISITPERVGRVAVMQCVPGWSRSGSLASAAHGGLVMSWVRSGALRKLLHQRGADESQVRPEYGAASPGW